MEDATREDANIAGPQHKVDLVGGFSFTTMASAVQTKTWRKV